jgi:hypothetical protein
VEKDVGLDRAKTLRERRRDRARAPARRAGAAASDAFGPPLSFARLVFLVVQSPARFTPRRLSRTDRHRSASVLASAFPESPHGPSQAIGEFIARVMAAQGGA